MSGTILVVGATGTVGREVAWELERRGDAVRLASRDPASASRRSGLRAPWVELDLENSWTFDVALHGVERVFLGARPGDDRPERVAAPLLEAMRRAKVRLLVNVTGMGAGAVESHPLWALERMVERSGLAYTHLRPNTFMQTLAAPPLATAIRATGALRVPAAAARVAWVDARDVAAVAVACLTVDGHDGEGYTLTGGEALDHAEAARLLGEAAGRAVTYAAIGEAEARAELTAAGLPPARIERLLRVYRWMREGHCARVTPSVEEILGRPAIRFARFAADHAAAWR